MSEKKRENWIDFVKLLAMLIVVMNHAGCSVKGVSFWGGMFFVPVFFVLSGYTYSISDHSMKETIQKKAKRLLLPYLWANIFLFAFFYCKDVLLTHTRGVKQMLTSLVGIFYARNQLFEQTHWSFIPYGKTNYYLMTNLNSPTWFLPALFLTIVVFEVALYVSKKEMKKLWLIATVLYLIAVVYHYACPLLLPFSIDSVPLFYVMFLTGYCIKQKDVFSIWNQKRWMVVILVVLLLASAYINGSANYSIGEYGNSMTLALYNAIASSTLVMYLCQKCDRWIPKILAILGQKTLFILCYHMLILAILEMFAFVIPLFVRVLTSMILLAVVGYYKDNLERKIKNAKK